MITLSSCSTIMNMRVENWAKDHIDKIYNNGTMGHICSPNMVNRKNTSIYLFREINKNPFVKYPQYESIFCGNSYMGNMEGYGINEITEKVFSLYGIELESNYILDLDGFKVKIDGYSKEKKIGFWYINHEDNEWLKIQKDENVKKKINLINKYISENKINLFVADSKKYRLYDFDSVSPIEFYFSSVADYLNWFCYGTENDLNEIFGKQLEGYSKNDFYGIENLFPGTDFENSDDLKYWNISNADIAISDKWSQHGFNSLELELKKDNRLVYTIPENFKKELRKDNCSFEMSALIDTDRKINLEINFDIYGDNNKIWSFKKNVSDSGEYLIFNHLKKAPFKYIKKNYYYS